MFFLILPIGLFIAGIIDIRETRRELKRIKLLSKKGVLVKKLPYKVKNITKDIDDNRFKIIVNYFFNGQDRKLVSNIKYDKKKYDSDGYVDLLIDRDDPENYIIDFEINRIPKNTQFDYYNDKNKENYYNKYRIADERLEYEKKIQSEKAKRKVLLALLLCVYYIIIFFIWAEIGKIFNNKIFHLTYLFVFFGLIPWICIDKLSRK